MQIISPIGDEIRSLDDWEHYFASGKKAKHWQEGRSAFEIADYVMNKEGVSNIQELVQDALSLKLEFHKAIPEYEVRFDSYGHGREHDLGLWGTTTSGQSVFIGVEAKVDEPFNQTVKDVYLKAICQQIKGVSTNVPKRIENLIRMNFEEPEQALFDLRYQLLYATAGTVAEPAYIHIMLIIVFKTDKYDYLKGLDNYRDYLNFLNATSAECVNKSLHHHILKINEKNLNLIYQEVD